MSVLEAKLRRDLWANRALLSAVAAIVMVGVGCLVGFLSTSRNLETAKNDYYQRTLLADFWVDLKKAPVTEALRLAAIPGVAAVRPRLTADVSVDLPEVSRPLSGRLVSLPAQRRDVINNVMLRSGAWFTPGTREEVLVDHNFAAERNIAPGDEINLVIQGERRSLRVAGTAISSEFVYLMPPGSIAPQPADYGAFYVPRPLAEEIMGFEGACNSLVGVLTPEARRQPRPVLDELSRRLHPYGVFAATPLAQQASNLALTSELSGLGTMAMMLPLVFLSVAALVLNVLMTRLAEQQRSVVGTLKALGYHNRRIMGHFLQVGAFVGLAGGLLGCCMGWLLAAGLTEAYKGFFTFPALENRLYPDLMALAVLTALAFGMLGAARGVRNVTRLSPAEAMRQAAPAEGGGCPLERVGWFWRRLGFRWQLSLRNIFRNRVRTLAGAFASAMGTALLVSTFGMVDSLRYMVDFQFDKVLAADYTLSFNEELDYGAVYEIAALPGVQRVEPVLEAPCDFSSGPRRKKAVIKGVLPDAQLIRPRDASGAAVPIPSTGLLMSRRLAESLALDSGDVVLITPTKGLQETQAVRVAQVVDSMFGLEVYADYRYLNSLVHEEAAVSSLLLRTQMTPAERESFLLGCKNFPGLTNIGDRILQRGLLQTSFVDKLGAMAYPMILFGAVIFFGSILNASLIGIIERKREIATYRVLGYSPMQVGNLLLRENLVVNLAGVALGLPLGAWMIQAMSVQFRNDMYAMPAVVSPFGWSMSIGLALLFIFLCQLIIQRSVNRLQWNEALSMKE